jgi:hypothetical protein
MRIVARATVIDPINALSEDGEIALHEIGKIDVDEGTAFLPFSFASVGSEILGIRRDPAG